MFFNKDFRLVVLTFMVSFLTVIHSSASLYEAEGRVSFKGSPVKNLDIYLIRNPVL